MPKYTSQDNYDVLTCTDADAEVQDRTENEVKYRTDTAKNYIPKWCSKKSLKPYYIGTSIIIIILIIIIIAVTIFKKPYVADKITKLVSDFPREIILCDNTRFYVFDTNNNEFTLLLETENSVGAFVMRGEEHIFFSETNNSRIHYLSNEQLRQTRKNASIFFEEERLKPQAMALDEIGQNLYVIDKNIGALVIINIETKYHSLVLTDLKDPSDIVMDSSEGLMFILQLSDSILRGDMDGKSLSKIIENTDVTAITIDLEEKRIYWVRDFSNIESSTYDGKNRQFFLIDSVNIVSLAKLGDQLFWLWSSYGSVKATLLSCKINNGTCIEYNTQTLNTLENPKLMKIKSSKNQIFNPCKIEGIWCQHLCIPTSKKRASCACNLGWELNLDLKKCRQIISFILYERGGFVRERIIDPSKSVSVDAIWPTLLYVESVQVKGSIDFDYDLSNDDFYYSDDNNIYKIKLKNQSNRTVVMSSDLGTVLEDLAYDWLTGNLYYSQRSKSQDGSHKLIMFNVKLGSDFKKTLIYFKYDSFPGLQACPYATVIHPSRGYLFFSAWEEGRSDGWPRFIRKTSMNGSTLLDISNNNGFIHEYRLLALDYVKDRLYKISQDVSPTVISHTNLNFSDSKYFTVDFNSSVKTIFVDQQWLYLNTDSQIWRVNKETGKNEIQITPILENSNDKKISGIRVISPFIQINDFKNNPCADKNGGCEQFCFYNGTMMSTCDCKDGDTLIDNKDCV